MARFVLESLPHELACRLAKRHGLDKTKQPNHWQLAESARELYKKANACELAVLIFEGTLLGSVANPLQNDDPLTLAAALYKINTKTLRYTVNKEQAAKMRKRDSKQPTPERTVNKPKRGARP